MEKTLKKLTTDQVIETIQKAGKHDLMEEEITRLVRENADREMAARFAKGGPDYLARMSGKDRAIYDYLRDRLGEDVNFEKRNQLNNRVFKTMAAENRAFRAQLYDQEKKLENGESITEVKSVGDITREARLNVERQETERLNEVIRAGHVTLTRHISKSTGLEPDFAASWQPDDSDRQSPEAKQARSEPAQNIRRQASLKM